MFGFSYFKKKQPILSNPPFIIQLEKTLKANQEFMSTIQSWRNLQIKYIGQMMEIQTKIRDRMEQICIKTDCQFLGILQTVVKSHKGLITKINQEIIDSNFTKLTEILQEQRIIIEQQKNKNKNLSEKKKQYNRLKQKQQILRKSLLEGLAQQICCSDSITQENDDQKIKAKVSQIQKQNGQHHLKMKQAKQCYNPLLQKSKQNLKHFEEFQQNFVAESLDITKKAISYVQLFGQSLVNDISTKVSIVTNVSFNAEGSEICQQFENQQEIVLKQNCEGYLAHTIDMIKNKKIDEIIEYSKNKEIRKKIKGIIQSNEISPEMTDEISRQVQLVKKILKTKEKRLIKQFKDLISKNTKFRMNFVFMLQLYRINSKFEMTEEQVEPIIILVNELLIVSHARKDTLVLKQLIILLVTYFITIKVGDTNCKIYIIDFFKKIKFFKDQQLWQSMLIQSIYSQKKATIRLLLKTSCISNKNQFEQAEKTMILNQILYVVKNMILFNFTENQVKQFASKFMKILKQDNQFLTDVYGSIDNAIKQELIIQTPSQNALENHQFYKIINGVQQF